MDADQILTGSPITWLLIIVGAGLLASILLRPFLQNLLAGFLLRSSRSIRPGDDIECADAAGRVERIGFGRTYLRKESGELVVMPNILMFQVPTVTRSDGAKKQLSVVLRIESDGGSEFTVPLLRAGLARIHGGIATDFDVLATGFEGSSLVISVRWWCGPRPIDEVRSQDAVLRAIMGSLISAGVELKQRPTIRRTPTSSPWLH